MPDRVIGLDIGGTKILAALGDGGGANSPPIARPTPDACRPAALTGLIPGSAAYAAALAAGREALLGAITAICHTLIAASDGPVRAIGIGTAGQVDHHSGVVIDASENLVGWKGTAVAEAISAACGGIPVRVDNDVRTMALAELVYGAARGLDSALCLTIGTGIGGAIISGGRVWHGAHFSAGEIGYLYAGDGETVESRCSGVGIAQAYAAAHGLESPLPLTTIAARAEAGDAGCAAAIAEGARLFGTILAPALMLIDPEAVIIGGGVPEIGPRWWDPFTAAVRANGLHTPRVVPLLPAALGTRAGLVGACLLAQHSFDTRGQADTA